MTQKIVYDFAWVGLFRIYSKYQNLIKKIHIEAVDIEVQNPVVFTSVMYPHSFEDKNESKMYLRARCNCFIFYFLFPFCFKSSKKHVPKTCKLTIALGLSFIIATILYFIT